MSGAPSSASVSQNPDGRTQQNHDYLPVTFNSTTSSMASIDMFNQQQNTSSTELLLSGATNAFDPSPSSRNDVTIGNGYGTTTGADSSNQSSSAFDLSDFPSLGGGVTSAGGASSNGLAAVLRQQQLLAAQQQMMGGNGGKTSNLYRLAMSSSGGGGNGGGTGGGAAAAAAGANFNMATEDFPALPGAPAPGGSNLLGGLDGREQPQQQSRDGTSGAGGQSSSNYGVSSTASSGPNVTPSRRGANGGSNGSSNPLGGSSGLYGGELEGGTGTLGNAPRDGGLLAGAASALGGLPTGTTLQHNVHQQRTTTTATTSTGSGAVGSALSGDYGLLGLLGVIRMSDADRNALALGSDLTSLGLNLNSSDHLYSTFASPWSESPTTREPQYQLPMCYYMQPPALKTGHLSKFQLETLFYIFYALPKDVLQAYAAQELYAREWRYHVDLKLWFKRASPADGVPSVNSGVQYIYFDINSWERRLFNGSMHQNITGGLLSEEDVRVKFPNS